MSAESLAGVELGDDPSWQSRGPGFALLPLDQLDSVRATSLEDFSTNTWVGLDMEAQSQVP